MADLAIIMSVYKNDKLKYVAESIQSILNQTFDKFDYFIIFDGPVSSEIDNYIKALNDSRISLSLIDLNCGLAKALNYLIGLILRNPEYAFIARMDADDISGRFRIEHQRNFLIQNPQISCVGCWYQEIDDQGELLRNIELPVDPELIKKRYYLRTPFAHPSVMYRRELVEKAGFYPTDTILMEDCVLWGKALKTGLQFANIPEYLFKFRIDKGFYKRRSGFRYGWNYIKTKFRINHNLNLPFYYYLPSLAVGVIKMFPPSILKYFYSYRGKHTTMLKSE
jgi:glycosyltransferase involved in cell wall biosynthesis